jgi:hypothetical protein
MSAPVVYCQDCKHVRPSSWFDPAGFGDRYRFARCTSPHLGGQTLVSRGGTDENEFCSVQRTKYETIDTCGREGRYFEPKRPAGVTR